MQFQIGAMTVGDILDRGFKLLLARLPTFYVINLVVLLPVLIWQLALPPLITGQMDNRKGLALLGSTSALFLAALIVSPFGTAAVLYVIAQEFIDQRATVAAAFAFAFQRFFSLLFLSLLFGLLVFVGLCCFCLPGILLTFAFPFVAQIVVMEEIGPFEVFGRMRVLTRGFRGRFFGLVVLLIIIQLAGSMVEGLLQPVLPGLEPRLTSQWTFELELYSYSNHIVHTIVGFLSNTVTQAYATICLSLFYFDLRIRKEGYDLELAAKQQRGTTP